MRYDAKAIGSGSEAAQSELQDKWNKVSAFYGSPRLRLHHILGNVLTGCTDPDAQNLETGDGGKAGSAQCTISTGMSLFLTLN